MNEVACLAEELEVMYIKIMQCKTFKLDQPGEHIDDSLTFKVTSHYRTWSEMILACVRPGKINFTYIYIVVAFYPSLHKTSW